MKKLIPVLAFAAALPIALVGCAASSPVPVESSSSGDSTLPLVEAGVLTVASSLNYPPESYKNADGSVGGFDIDILRAIGDYLGVEVEFREVKFEQAIIGLTGAQYDTYPGLYITPERLEAIDMVPYFQTGNSILALADGLKPADETELCGLSIAVLTGASIIAKLEAQSAECEANGEGAIQIRNFPTDPEASQAVVAGNVDVQITLTQVARELEKNVAALSITNSKSIYPSVAALGVTKGNQALVDALQRAIDALVADGTMGEIYAEYDLLGVDPDDVKAASGLN